MFYSLANGSGTGFGPADRFRRIKFRGRQERLNEGSTKDPGGMVSRCSDAQAMRMQPASNAQASRERFAAGVRGRTGNVAVKQTAMLRSCLLKRITKSKNHSHEKPPHLVMRRLLFITHK